MIDNFHLGDKNNVSIFYGACCQNYWQTWYKNPISQTVTIFCLGGGGGGAAGFGGITNKNGGGGGGSAAYTIATYPSSMLPDTLFVNVGSGGSGGTLVSAGQVGNLSYVSVNANSKIAADTVCISGTVAAQGGVGGSTVTGGDAGTMATILNCPFLGNSTYYTFVGQQGAAGGVAGGATPGLSLTAITTSLFSGGAGGGGGGSTTSTSGGTIWSNNSIFPNIVGGVSVGGVANNGISFLQPFCGVGGSGGGGNSGTGNIGGKGGNGSYGCGGGGGGCAHETASVGAGGSGGNGIVIIITT